MAPTAQLDQRHAEITELLAAIRAMVDQATARASDPAQEWQHLAVCILGAAGAASEDDLELTAAMLSGLAAMAILRLRDGA